MYLMAPGPGPGASPRQDRLLGASQALLNLRVELVSAVLHQLTGLASQIPSGGQELLMKALQVEARLDPR